MTLSSLIALATVTIPIPRSWFCLCSPALHRELPHDFDFGLQRRHRNRIGRQAGVPSVDINQRIDLAVNTDRRNAPDEYRVRSVVEACFLGADDVRLRVGQNRDAGVLTPCAVTEAIFAAGLTAAAHGNFDLV